MIKEHDSEQLTALSLIDLCIFQFTGLVVQCGSRAIHWAAETTIAAMAEKQGAGSIFLQKEIEFSSEIIRVNYKSYELAEDFACHQYVLLDLLFTLQSHGNGSNFYLLFLKWSIIQFLVWEYPKYTSPVI